MPFVACFFDSSRLQKDQLFLIYIQIYKLGMTLTCINARIYSLRIYLFFDLAYIHKYLRRHLCHKKKEINLHCIQFSVSNKLYKLSLTSSMVLGHKNAYEEKTII